MAGAVAKLAACPSVELNAARSGPPPGGDDGVVRLGFSAGLYVPASFAVTQGDRGRHTATLFFDDTATGSVITSVAEKPVATIFAPGALPLQIATDELIFYPGGDAAKLGRFLAATGGTVIAQDPLASATGGALGESYLVHVDASAFALEDLPQLQLLVGHDAQLYASDPAALRLLGMALSLRLDGFTVAVDPRLQYASPPTVTDSALCPGTIASTTCPTVPPPPPPAPDPATCLDPTIDKAVMDPEFGGNPVAGSQLNRTWPLLALLDADRPQVKVAFLDQGFAPNEDFEFDGQCDMTRRTPTCGPGVAEGVPTTGASLFGERLYHGNYMVTAAGGRVNNGFGTHGIGGQVVVPMLYKMERLLTCSLLALPFEAALWAACAATSWIPIVGVAMCGIAAGATIGAATMCVESLPLGDLRSPMFRGLAYAETRGVPVVTAAGNDLASTLSPMIRSFIDESDLDARHWQIVPCVLHGAICVGSADPDVVDFPNTDFNGSGVALWAPSPEQYYAPCSADNAASPIIRHEESPSTSAATAFISGTVATLMAADPELDPARTSSSLSFIPGLILSDLLTTAAPAMGARGRLVRPFEAVKSVIGFDLYAALGYPSDLDLGELTSDPSDALPGTRLDLGSPAMTGTVLALGPTDRDCYYTRPPTEPGVYAISVSVTSPVNFSSSGGFAFDPPLLVEPGFDWVRTSVTSTTLETTETFTRTGILRAEVVSFCTTASATSGAHDNFYKIAVTDIVQSGDARDADRFDLDDSSNPPESRPNNNTPERAVILGVRTDAFTDWLWSASDENPLNILYTLNVPNLNFGSLSDGSGGPPVVDLADDFVAVLPEHPYVGTWCCARDGLTVDAGTSAVHVRLHQGCNGGDSSVTLAEGDGRASYDSLHGRDPGGPPPCVGIEITPVLLGGPIVEYSLSVTADVPGSSCRTLSFCLM